MISAVVVDTNEFLPLRVDEERLEGLLRTAAPAVFPGFDYYDFRPAVRCGSGTRHPDGVLLATGHSAWWVVEVETHLHSVSEHIEPQLRDLASGYYGPNVFAYLERHEGFDASTYPVDPYEPNFLLVIDSLTPEIRDAAARTGFSAIECGVFRSGHNQYALAVSGHRPRRDARPPAVGIDLVLSEIDAGIASLAPADGGPLPPLKTTTLVIAGREVQTSALRDKRGLVLPVSQDDVTDALGGATTYRLAPDGTLTAKSDTTE